MKREGFRVRPLLGLRARRLLPVVGEGTMREDQPEPSVAV